MKRVISIFLAVAMFLSLTACKRNGNNEETAKEDLVFSSEQDATDTSDFFSKEVYLGNTGIIAPNLRSDEQGEHLEYRGGTVKLSVTTNGNKYEKTEYGFYLLLNGIHQSFTLKTPAGESRNAAYLQTFTIEAQETKHFDLEFTPNTGKAGDVLPLTLCYIIQPSYTAVYDGYGSYGHFLEHRYLRASRLFLHMQADAPTQALPANVSSAPADVPDVYRSWFVGEDLNNWGTTYHVTLYTDRGIAEQGTQLIEVPRRKNAELTLDVFGMAANWRASLFVNHALIELTDGCTYFDFSTDAKSVTRLTLPVDTSDLPKDNHTYLILTQQEDGTDPIAVKGTFDYPQKYGTYYFIVGGKGEAK